MKSIHWVIQKNLIREETLQRLRNALQSNQISYEEVFVIPFSTELPEIQHPGNFNVFYGSTTLMLNAYQHPTYQQGVFYHPDRFKMATYLDHWKDHMLNSNGWITSFRDFIHSHQHADSIWFVRPNADTKTFNGTVMRFADIQTWGEKLGQLDDAELTLDSLILVSPPKSIDKEWRSFIVDGKVVSSCRYVEKGEVSISATDIPPAMIAYVEARCQEYTPHPIFVMDIALAENRYAVLECNCFNGTGFYANDVHTIIRSVTAYIQARIQQVQAEKAPNWISLWE